MAKKRGSGAIFLHVMVPSFLSLVVVLFLLPALMSGPALGQTTDLVVRSALRVCADPANLPFSNKARKGFENKIAGFLGEKLDVPVLYTWFPQATGFIRMTLRAKRCDLVIGYAQGHELVQNTNHYYRSSYVLIHRDASFLAGIKNLNDNRLKGAKIGVIAGTPPATTLALNGLFENVKGYRLMVDSRYDSSTKEMIGDLLSKKIDVGLLWGPIGGYYAKNSAEPLTIVPLVNETKGPRMVYRVTMGIRPNEKEWKRQLNRMIKTYQKEINQILTEYGVPLLDEQDRIMKR